ncbi:MAG: acyl-ACP--UDP-N-acetylglucosamine O-acyltransferase [Gammaproteobacteria bacterium]|nr:acyl-ACP--UDP-N-acetylglucosamine O-acyltransferase [Gammaproteobacteria bacterium]
MIHPSAIIHETAKIDSSVSVGPWSYIGADVEIGAGTIIGPHVCVEGPTTLGQNNHIHPYASIGGDPQDKKYAGGKTRLEIGDGNSIREFVTINRGTEQGGHVTRLGNHNLLMAYVHIAHDCIVGDHVIFANNASLAGHVIVRDHAILSGFSAVHQFVIIGAHSFVAHAGMVGQDVLPYVLVSGDPAEPFGINSLGIKRRGFSDEQIAAIKSAYKTIFRQGLKITEAIDELKQKVGAHPEIALMLEALENPSSRGIAR